MIESEREVIFVEGSGGGRNKWNTTLLGGNARTGTSVRTSETSDLSS